MSRDTHYECHVRVNATKLDHLVKQFVARNRGQEALRALFRSGDDVWRGLDAIPTIIEKWYNHVSRELGHTDHLTSQKLLLDSAWRMFCQRCSVDIHLITPTDRNYGLQLIDVFVNCVKDAVYLRIPLEKPEAYYRASDRATPRHTDNTNDIFSTRKPVDSYRPERDEYGTELDYRDDPSFNVDPNYRDEPPPDDPKVPLMSISDLGR